MDLQQNFGFKSARKAFSRCGIALILFFAATFASQILIGMLFGKQLENMSRLSELILSSATMYLIGFPVFYLSLNGIDTFEGDSAPCSLKTLGVAFVISMTLMYFGQILGDVVAAFFYNTFNILLVSESLEIIGQIKWYEALIFSVIIGPFVEELMFRKLIIDRTRGYGEKLSIVFSALMFGFFHMSPQQFFYAFFIGLLYGYLYIRKGKLLYCWLLHAVFNFFGGTLPLILMQFADYEKFLNAGSYDEMYKMIEANPIGFGAISAYSLATLVMSFVGIGWFLKRYRRIRFERALFELPKDSEATTAFVNVGVILFIAFTIIYPLWVATM